MTLPLPWPDVRKQTPNGQVLDPDAVQQNLEKISTQWPQAASTVLTTLPVTARDGQVLYVNADATNGVVWQFRYRAASSSSYKWEFVGGAPLVAKVDTAESRSTASFADLTTAGPSITLPALAGDYECDFGVSYSAGAVDGDSYVGLAVNGSVLGTAGTAGNGMLNLGGTNQPASAKFVAWQAGRFDGIAASAVLKLMYRGGSGISTTFDSRVLRVRPVRVAGS